MMATRKDTIRNAVLPYYSEPHRAYHTIEHADAVYHCFLRYEPDPSISDMLAIYYHDAVYLPWSKTNEVDSANLLRLHFKQRLFGPIGITYDMIETACQMIMATAHPSNPQTKSEKALIDADLTILAAEDDDWMSYDEYVLLVRQEYAIYSDSDWIAGRIRVLESILAQPNIFLVSNPVTKQKEERARKNMLKELERLKNELRLAQSL